MLDMTEEEFRRRFSGSPLKRAKLVRLKRNVCVALGNSGDISAVPALAKALVEGEPLARRHAAWALGRLGDVDARAALGRALLSEADKAARQEIKDALASVESGL